MSSLLELLVDFMGERLIALAGIYESRRHFSAALLSPERKSRLEISKAAPIGSSLKPLGSHGQRLRLFRPIFHHKALNLLEIPHIFRRQHGTFFQDDGRDA